MQARGSVALVVAAFLGSQALAQGTGVQDTELRQTIRTVVEDAHHPNLRWAEFPYYEDELRALYEPGGFAPFWFAAGTPRPAVRPALDLLLDAASRGLDPRDYDANLLDATWRESSAGQALTGRELALFDTGLSVATLRFISDLHIGRVTPARVKAGFDTGPKKYDLAALLREAAERNALRAAADAAEPNLAVYKRLRAALSESRRGASRTPLPHLAVTPPVRPGDACAALPALYAHLAAVGDVDSIAVERPSTAARYEGEMVEAVRRFQLRHGLAADGVIGKATLAALDVPAAQRARQIELAMERLRWLPDLEPGPVVAVNIPAFQLWGFDSLSAAGTPVLHMRVVVGKAMDAHTPIFLDYMEYVVFRPYWNVPYSILKGELLPALQRDPQALEKRDMEIVRGFDATTALPVTPENIASLRAGTLQVRQRPGPRNALGPAKFIFPNGESVYMHGTPAQALFERSRRDFSHGCIRLEDPVAFAQFVLADQPAWTRARIVTAMEGTAPQRANLKRHLPVILFYSTAMVGRDGRVFFYDDVYGNDARLERELQNEYSYQP